ncbi:MAG: helix-turn-helix domain-containing protein [Parvibaculaceae bacterium]
MNKLIWHEFSTNVLPESERFPVFCEELIRRQVALDVVARRDMQFSGTIKRCLLGMVDVARITTTVASYVRTPELVSDGRDAVFAVICLDGSMLCTQSEEPVRIGPGEGVICDSVEPGGLQMETETRYWALKVARADMAKTAPHIRRFAGLRLNNTGMAVKLLTRYLDGLQGGDAVADAREARIFGEHLLDLIGMAIGVEEETRQLAERRGVRAVRHAAVLREIERNIGDNRLSAAVVAEKLGVTPRYVHFLLEESGRTFSEHVLARRLKLVEELLGDADKGTLKISAIARQAGFTDMSYFNRCFRHHFGDTPTGYRKRCAPAVEPAPLAGAVNLKCA